MMLTHCAAQAYDHHQPSMHVVPELYPVPAGYQIECQPSQTYAYIDADFIPYSSRGADEFVSSTESFEMWPDVFGYCSTAADSPPQSFGASPYSSCSSASVIGDVPFAYDVHNSDAMSTGGVPTYPAFDELQHVGYQNQRSCEYAETSICGWESPTPGLSMTSLRRSPPSYTEHVSRMGCAQPPQRLQQPSWINDVTPRADSRVDDQAVAAMQGGNGIKRMSKVEDSSSLKSILKFFGSVNSGSSHVQLWQFLLELLLDPASNSTCIRWENVDDGEFQMVDPDKVAQKWGERKKRTNMNYDKMGRAMRYYYEKMILSKIPGKKCTYRFHVAGLMCQGRRTLGSKLVSFCGGGGGESS